MISLPWRKVGIDGGPEIGTSETIAELEKLRELATGHIALEVGSAYGMSAITMAKTAKHVFAIDPHIGLLTVQLGPHTNRDSLSDMRKNLREYDCEKKVTILLGYSYDILPMLASAGAKFGCIFIDGDHNYPAVFDDARWSNELVAPGGVIAYHDYDEMSCPGVRQALDEMYPDGPDGLVDTLFVKRA
jgi:predicted O-methyltransferase YrrM